MNWKILRVASVIGLAVLAVVLLSISRPMGHTLTLKAYFSNGMALCPGAPVRLAGVDVGSVKSVRARPEMKETPVDDFMTKHGVIRADGRLVRDMYLFQVKAPAESRGGFDYYKLVATIPGEKAFRPLGEGGCKLVTN